MSNEQYTVKTCIPTALNNMIQGGASAQNIAIANAQKGAVPALTLLHRTDVSTQLVGEKSVAYSMNALNVSCELDDASNSVCADSSDISETRVEGMLQPNVFKFKARVKKDSVVCDDKPLLGTPFQDFVATVEQGFLRQYQSIEKWVTRQIAENSTTTLPNGQTTEMPMFYNSSSNDGLIRLNTSFPLFMATGISMTSLTTMRSAMIATNNAAMASAFEGGVYYTSTPQYAQPQRILLNQNSFSDTVMGDGKRHIFQVYEGQLAVVSFSYESPQATQVSNLADLDRAIIAMIEAGNVAVRKFWFRDNIGLLWIMEVTVSIDGCDDQLGNQTYVDVRFSTTLDTIIPAKVLPTECGLNGKPAIYNFYDGYNAGLPANTEPEPEPTLPTCVNILSSTTCSQFESFSLYDSTPTLIGVGTIDPIQNPSSLIGLVNCLNVICESVVPIGNAIKPFFKVEAGAIKYYDNGNSLLITGGVYTLESTGSCDGKVSFEIVSC